MDNILKLEELFSNNSYKGSLYEDSTFMYKRGRIPVLISVPHGVCTVREGKLKNAEIFTGAIGLLLHIYTGAHVIAKTITDDDDPTYNEYSPYCLALEEIVNEEDIALVIDIHGVKNTNQFCIDLGTNRGNNLSDRTLNKAIEAFKNNGAVDFNISIDSQDNIKDKNRIVNKVKTNNVETLQVKINEVYRLPHPEPDKFEAVIVGLADFIISVVFEPSPEQRLFNMILNR